MELIKIFILMIALIVNRVDSESWIQVCQSSAVPYESCKCPALRDFQERTDSHELSADLFLMCSEIGIPLEFCSYQTLEDHYSEHCLRQPVINDEDVQAECREIGLSKETCTCPNLYHAKNLTSICYGDLLAGSLRENPFTDLNEICEYFSINVTCKCPDIGNINATFKQICDFFKQPTSQDTKCEIDSYTKGRKIFVIIVSIFGIIGNSLVIIIRSQQWKNSIHYRLISGLALTDLTFSVLQILYNAPAIGGHCKWGYGPVMCKMHALLGISYSIDLGFTVIISIERFIAIVYPISNFFEKGTALCCVLFNITYSIIGVIPAIMVLNISETGICQESWAGFPLTSLQYTWILMVFYFLVPVTITAVLYNKSMCELKRSLFRRISAIHGASRNKLLLENRRILLVMNTILVTLVLLVSPHHIYWLVMEYVGSKNIDSDMLIVFRLIAYVPFSLTVMINPVIYSLVDRHFRLNASYLLLNLKHRNINFSSSSTTLNTFLMAERQPPLLSSGEGNKNKKDGA